MYWLMVLVGSLYCSFLLSWLVVLIVLSWLEILPFFQVKYRVAWIKQQEAQKRREEEEAERERVSYAQVKLDCHWLREMELKLSLIWRPTVFPLIENTNSRTFGMLLRNSTDECHVRFVDYPRSTGQKWWPKNLHVPFDRQAIASRCLVRSCDDLLVWNLY